MAIPFFLDHCVPASVGQMLAANGHPVTYLKDALATDTPDPIVAAVCEKSGEVLVSFDKDFKGIAKGGRHQKLNRVYLRCSEPKAVERMEAALSLIEHEWDIVTHGGAERMYVEILGMGIKTYR